MKHRTTFGLLAVTLAAIAIGYFVGFERGQNPSQAVAQGPNDPVDDRAVYYPGTEQLADGEVRVIACGTGMPDQRLAPSGRVFLSVEVSVHGEWWSGVASGRPNWGANCRFDYGLTIVVLDLDEEDKGEGRMAIGVKLKLDMDAKQLEIENFSSEPVRLTNVSKSS